MSDSNKNKISDEEMKERYIHEVLKHIPQKQRIEIKLELEELIGDMEEEGTTEEILLKLGNPKDLAKSYRDENNYVVGPDYYDNYIWIIKIGVIALAISALISAVVHGLTDGENIKGFIKEFCREGFRTAISGMISLVGMVTVIFVILERLKIKVDLKSENEWSPSTLPAIPQKKEMLSRSGSVVAIIVYIILIGLLVYVPEIFGIFEKTDTGIKSISSVFNLEKWNSIMPLFIAILVVGIFDEIVKIIHGKYCNEVMYSSIICNIIEVVLSYIVLKCTDIWNASFGNDLLVYSNRQQYSTGDILYYWGTDRISNILFCFIFVLSCIEVANNVYKTLKYKERIIGY